MSTTIWSRFTTYTLVPQKPRKQERGRTTLVGRPREKLDLFRGPAGPLAATGHRRGRLHPFESEAANLFFQLVSSRYERTSLIVASNKPFGRSGQVFGDFVTAAMIDRLVHHAEVIAFKGDSYRFKDRDLGRVPAAGQTEE